MMDETPLFKGLKVGIVGAGVAGLAAAIALRRVGHECELFERSQFKNENGAAVSITPNGGRILKRWGFDSVKTGGIEIKQVRRPRGDTLEPMAPVIDFSDVRERFGDAWYFYHRVDMHKHLREMAVDSGLPGVPSVINLGRQVVDVDPDAGLIVLKDRSEVQKDLVIIADGQHDILNSKISGLAIPTQKSGQTAYRCLIPMRDVLDDPVTRPMFEKEAPGFWAPSLPSKGVMCVTYPCRAGQILNCLIVARKLADHARGEDDATIEDWNFPATREMLEAVLDGFHPAVKTLMLKSPEIKMYTQMKRKPLPRIFKGKALLIGDACHPMLLTHAQGVSSSLEDAAALEVLLEGVSSYQTIPTAASELLTERLELFQSLRLPRLSATQIMTEPIVPGPTFAEMATAADRTIRQYYQGLLPPMTSTPHSPQICDFFFKYDVRQEAINTLVTAQLAKLKTLTKTGGFETSEIEVIEAVV